MTQIIQRMTMEYQVVTADYPPPCSVYYPTDFTCLSPPPTYCRSDMIQYGSSPPATPSGGLMEQYSPVDQFSPVELLVPDELSNASTVAIDNKIEQAMDLVKSHLMFAVREEVEVLKEQIKELTEKNNHLLDKNNQLEYENNILKGAAAPETLAELQTGVVTQPPTSTS